MKTTLNPVSNRQELVARAIVQADNLKSKALAAIRSAGALSEGELLQAIFPAPAFPAVAFPPENPAAAELIEGWRKADDDYRARAFYRAGVVEYRDCYSALLAEATIALAAAGLIRTTNNGFNSYTYHAR